MIPNSKILRAFSVHGAHDLTIAQGSEQAIGACPFCFRKGKLYVNSTTGQWDCKVCGESGNLGTFLARISKRNHAQMKGKALRELSQNRGLSATTLLRFGVGWDGTHYTVPHASLTHGMDSLADLKMFQPGQKLKSTPSCKTCLFCLPGLLSVPATVHQTIYLMEGEWDVMAMDECLRVNNKHAGSIVLCGSSGAGSFRPEWMPLFQDRDVVIVYDHDKAGVAGTQKAFGLLQGIVRSVRYVTWPEDTTDGYDFRDLYRATSKDALGLVSGFMGLALNTPVQSNAGPAPKKSKKGLLPTEDKKPEGAGIGLFSGSGLEWGEVIAGYREWLLLPQTDQLAVMFGTLFANRLPGDPVWMFLVAPPGGCKSELLMTLSKSPGIYPITTFTAHTLISGAVGVGGTDPSLLPKLNGQVLVVKDFTTVLTMPETIRDEILGILRDAYDGEAGKVFGTGVRRYYKSRFGVLAGVTPVIYQYSSKCTMLGERFLTYRLKMPGNLMGGEALITRALKNVTKEGGMRDALQVVARNALNRTISPDETPTITPLQKKRIIHLAQLVAMLRGSVAHERYTREVLTYPIQEVGTRVAKQLMKLAMGVSLAAFENEVTERAFRVICAVARDTVPDRVESIVRVMFLHIHEEASDLHCRRTDCSICRRKLCCTTAEVAGWTGLPPTTLQNLFEDMRMLNIIERAKGRSAEVGGLEIRWKLTAIVRSLLISADFFQGDVKWKKLSKQEEGEPNE